MPWGAFWKIVLKLPWREKCVFWAFKNEIFRRKLRIWPHLLKKSLMENFIFCAVRTCESAVQKVTFFAFFSQFLGDEFEISIDTFIFLRNFSHCYLLKFFLIPYKVTGTVGFKMKPWFVEKSFRVEIVCFSYGNLTQGICSLILRPNSCLINGSNFISNFRLCLSFVSPWKQILQN